MCLFLAFVHMYLSLCLAWSKMKGVCQWGKKKEQGVGGRKKTKSINMKTKMRTKMKTKGESMLKDIHFVKPPEEWNKYMTELNVRGGTKQMNKLRCLYVKYRQPVIVDKVVDKVRTK